MSVRLPRRKLSQEVLNGILELIRRGEIPAQGQIPTESELADRFQVSRTAVREGIRGLAAMGVLETRPGIGTFVVDAHFGPLRFHDDQAEPHADTIWREMMEARRIIEPETAALAAQRRTDDDLKELERCVLALEKAVEEGYKPPEDMGFHLALARATHNSALSDISYLITRFYQNDPELPDEIDLTAHLLIYEAVLAGNPKSAHKAMLRHFDELEQRRRKYTLRTESS